MFQSPICEAIFGGGEANVAVSLVNYGLGAGICSALTDSDIGEFLNAGAKETLRTL